MGINPKINEIILIIWIVLAVAYCLFVIIDEKKKYKKLLYYKKNLSYDIYYYKYIKMVRKMKKVLFMKKTELFLLNILVFFKESIVCKK